MRSNNTGLDPAACVCRLDEGLHRALGRLTRHAPSALSQALHHAVEPPGSRRRPLLLMAVAQALGDPCPPATDASAVALELIHCASLVHDDLPCFDDAPTRRGKASVHRAFGEALAVLTGDGLLLGAFETLAAADCDPGRRVLLVSILARAAGSPAGMVAGQAWESEPSPDLGRYHGAKTASAFEAATMMGAVSAGHEPQSWRPLGMHLGLAYQIADDLLDAGGDSALMGKPVGRDACLGRPSALRVLGRHRALAEFARHRDTALASIAPGAGHEALVNLVEAMFDSLHPPSVMVRKEA